MSTLTTILGAGLAGSEAALTLAELGRKVRLVEQKPKYFSPAHRLSGAAELVCSNSLKSLEVSSAHGLLKEELRMLGSPVLDCALETRIPGGKALAVDRERFSHSVTERIRQHPNIEFVEDRIDSLPASRPLLIATGPLTTDALMSDLMRHLGDSSLYFYDATSPVVTLESLDMSCFFWANRNQDGDDYLNLPLTKDQYVKFREDILSAQKVETHLPGEEVKVFEGCLPIEVLAERGLETLACSCMSPSGFRDKISRDIFAVIQFRREKAAGELLNLVGFQTRMKWPEQERVFRALPGMQNAEFVRLGAMHRNTYINAPLHLDERLQLKSFPGVYLAGQITGSEGYTEALATGHFAALALAGFPALPETSSIQSLVRYLVNSDPRYFQPMNFNFGLLPPLPNIRGKMKRGSRKLARNEERSARALKDLITWGEANRNQLQGLWKGSSMNSFAHAL